MKVGDICEGIITQIEPFGMFVDVDGVPGLLRIPELSWKQIRHPSDIADVGESVRFQVLNLNDPSKRTHEHFNGSIKVLMPKPGNREDS